MNSKDKGLLANYWQYLPTGNWSPDLELLLTGTFPPDSFELGSWIITHLRYRIKVKLSHKFSFFKLEEENKFSLGTHCDFPLALAIAAALKLLHHWQLLLLRLLLGHWQDVQLLVRGRRFFCHSETLAVTLQLLFNLRFLQFI